ncbi:uncharacterized protein LOC141880144 isoform X2 [Acropora palmata]
MALVYNVLFTTCVIAAVLRSNAACPTSCNCSSSGLSVTVNCKDESFTSILSELPANTSSINLTGSSIECDCKFYQSWKILKEKGIKIRGRCSESSVQLSRAAFQDLNKQSFAYCDESTSLVRSSETKQSSSTIVNTLISSSVISENTPPANRENVGVKATKSSQLTDVVKTSSIVVHAMTSAKSSEATLVITSSQVVPAVTSSQATPPQDVVTSSQATMKTTQAVVTTSKVGVTSSENVVTSSEGVVTSSQAPVTSFQAVVTSSQAMPVVVPDQQRSSSRVGVSSSGPVGVGLAPTPSSSTAKPAEVATKTVIPRILETSSSVATLKVSFSSTLRVDSSSSIASAQLSPPAALPVNESSTADVSPSASSVQLTFSSVAATTPPVTPLEAPVITLIASEKAPPLFSTVQVKCVSTGNPAPDIDITFNGQPAEKVDGVTVTSDSSQKMIEFKVERDSEIWCEARNALGRDKRNIRIAVDQTGVKYFLLRVELIKEIFNENMNNKESKEFQDIAKRVISQIRSVLGQDSGFVGTSLAKLWKGSVKADILVKTFEDKDDSVEKTLKAELDKAKIGNIPVDRYKYSFEPTQACTSEFLNVTWNDAAYGETDVVPCPRGVKGFAKRNCSTGTWYYPDYTDCKSDEFSSLKEQIERSTSLATAEETGNAFFTGLQRLLNLTTPNAEFAVMAGDLATSTEILQLVVGYLKAKKEDRAHNESEVKLVVELASHLLHLNNEQEFIVTQKLKQTASKFILALEEYGRMAAGMLTRPINRNLAILISENVVMGSGVADPRTIKGDVTFPNYQWTELADVKKKWNASTFLVLPQEMIKDLNEEKNGIRISGFMYRTLTRILSFESAYSNKGMAFEINSAVISMSVDPKPSDKLAKPVIIASRNLREVDVEADEEPICAFWDFTINAPHGGWSEEGCNISSYNRFQTTCQCDHMTNFAVLRKKAVTQAGIAAFRRVEDFIHCIHIAAWIIIAFAALTFLILLILCPWLEPDRTWAMHMCVCLSVIVTFVLILLGLASYNNLTLCNIYSFLVHYFFLCTFSWILTEGVYMRTWITERGPRKRYWIGYFLLGWGLPGVAVFITWLANKLIKFESFMSCWMSIFNPLIWVFFVPVVVFFLVSCIYFVIIWRAITGPPRQGLKNHYRNTRFRVHIRYSIILMLMFILTWLLGILLLTYYWKALLCILFIICCIITGFMLLLFYVIMDRQVREAFKYCICCWRRSRRGSYWVRGQSNELKTSPNEYEERERERQNERQRLVSEGTEQTEPDHDIEMNGVDKSGEHQEPLLEKILESSTESFDPLYDRVTHKTTVREVPPVPPTSEDGSKSEPPPIYQVVKPRRLRHPESDSDDDDELSPEELEARGMRGLTREQVIRMAKKSDASKRVLKRYESPSGSKENLGGPVYLLNQQEMDEELKQFRKFFDHDKTTTTSTTVTKHSSFRREESVSVSVTKQESPSARGVGSSATPKDTSADSPLQELDRRQEAQNEPSDNKPTDV